MRILSPSSVYLLLELCTFKKLLSSPLIMSGDMRSIFAMASFSTWEMAVYSAASLSSGIFPAVDLGEIFAFQRISSAYALPIPFTML